MNEVLDQPIKLGKVFKERAIGVAAFFGGPLIAGYLLSVNFKRIGKHTEAKLSIVLGVLIMLLVLSFSFFVPAAENIPDFLFTIAYAWGSLIIFQIFQKVEILDHIRKGGEVYSWWIVVGIIAIGVLVLFVIMLLYYMYEDQSYNFFL